MKAHCPYCQTDYNQTKTFYLRLKNMRITWGPFVLHSSEVCYRCKKPLLVEWTLTDVALDKDVSNEV
jgi:hypothetical protein